MSITPFTVLHQNPQAQEALGTGYVVGEVQRKTTVQTKGSVERDGQKIPAIITEEKVVVYYQVLWENAREVSPSLHKATDLQWQHILSTTTDDGDEYDDDDGDEFEDDDGETVELQGDIGGETGDTWGGAIPTGTPETGMTLDENDSVGL